MEEAMRELSNWVGVSTAAGILDMHRNSVHAAVRRGRLRGVMMDGRVLIYRPSIVQYAERSGARRGKKPRSASGSGSERG